MVSPELASQLLEKIKNHPQLTYNTYLESYTIPLATYSDYSGTALERGNLEYLQDHFSSVINDYSGGHNTHWGSIEDDVIEGLENGQIDNDEYNKLEELLGELDGLENYPAFDDEYMSKIKWDLYTEAYKDWTSYDFKNGIEKKFGEEVDLPEDKAEDFFYNMMNKYDIEHRSEDAVSCYIKIDDLIKKIKLQDIIDAFGVSVIVPDFMNELQLQLGNIPPQAPEYRDFGNRASEAYEDVQETLMTPNENLVSYLATMFEEFDEPLSEIVSQVTIQDIIQYLWF